MIKLFDTTLRDGTQSPNINLSVRDKMEIVKALDDFGVDYIELGWPGSNKKDMESFLEVAKLKLKKSKIVAFGSTRRMSLSADKDPNLQSILNSKVKVVCIFGKTWLEHVKKQLKSEADQNLKSIEDSIKYLKKNKRVVFYDLEHFFDGFKDNKEYALDCLKTASKAGADCLVLCDTNGGTLPNELTKIITEVKDFMKKEKLNIELGIHSHNDAGCAVANTLLASDLGVNQLHLTINGFGERAGNADLCQVVPNLILKKNVKLDVNLKSLHSLSDLAYTLANIKPNSAQPYVGKHAFKHKGGVHVDAVIKGASYEHVNPNLVGNKRDIVLSDLSGKSNIIELLKKFNIKAEKNDPNVAEMLSEVESLEKRGYDIGNLEAEKFLLANKFFGKKKEFFKIATWKVSSEQKNGEFSESILAGTINGKQKKSVAPVKGGPVDSIYKALKQLIESDYPKIETIKLINYKVMIAQDEGAESSVRVYIEFKNGSEEWGTVGVSTNILEASLEAIEKGFRYFLAKHY